MSQAFSPDQLQQALKQYWGYEQFRYPQAEVITTLLAGQDCLAVLPTGSGKSFCFQLPALIRWGLTLVVAPLVALMEDQVQALRKKGLPAVCLHSQLKRQEQQAVLQQLHQRQPRLLYCSPETLLSQRVWEIVAQPDYPLLGVMLDEAHCLVQWGESFRPAYRRLGAFRVALPQKNIPIAAFTATADQQQQDEICQALQLRQPQIFQQSPYRSQLRLQVKTSWSDRCRRHLALRFIRQFLGQSGLVYVRTRTAAITIAQWLQQQGINAAAYHGGLAASKRRYWEQQWLSGELPIVVCTSAFGLGINKPDTRWILHFEPPLLLLDYLQEIGRAGRDLKSATCLTLVSELTGLLDPSDRQRRQFFLKQQQQTQTWVQKQLPHIPQQGHIKTLKTEIPDIELALGWLHRRGLLHWQDPYHYQLLSTPAKSQQTPFSLSRQHQQMQQYLQTRQCRWQWLVSAFMPEVPLPKP